MTRKFPWKGKMSSMLSFTLLFVSLSYNIWCSHLLSKFHPYNWRTLLDSSLHLLPNLQTSNPWTWRQCCTLAVNLFLLELSPLIITSPKFLFHHSSICDLLCTYVECTMLQDFCKMNCTHYWLDLVHCRLLAPLQVWLTILDVYA